MAIFINTQYLNMKNILEIRIKINSLTHFYYQENKV